MLNLLLMVFGRRRADTDEDLMERFRDGDAGAFEELLARHERPVFHFIFRFVHDRELASDLMQETFLRVIKGAPTYSRKAKFTTWLYTIARNQCIDALRRGRYRRAVSLDAPPAGDPDGQALIEKVAGDGEDGHVRTDAGEVRGRIEDAIARLSNEQREVFVMRELMRMPFKDIADVVGVSENTIKSRMRYALENLRLALADYAADLPGAVDPVPARNRV
jgi:RNA polymerase sigma-70 factor (ECF subfamily)